MTTTNHTNLPTPEWVNVSPAIAREMLTHNTHNRNLKRQHHQYAEDMVNGDWKPEICDPIRFSHDGTLLDGQNRLHAVIEADITIPFLVVRGLPNDTQTVMDTGVGRKFADVLKLNGEDRPTTLAAVVRLSWEWGRGISYLTRSSATNTQLLRWLDEHPELRQYSNQRQRSIGDSCWLPASIVGCLWWVFAQIDEEDADYFFERLADDTDHHKGEPIHELRRTLKNNQESVRASRSRVWLLAITVKAWNAYRAGETVGLYRWKPGGKNPERFPEPK